MVYLVRVVCIVWRIKFIKEIIVLDICVCFVGIFGIVVLISLKGRRVRR